MPPPVPIAIPQQISRAHLLSLYSSYLRASSRFASYNFRAYFLRHSRNKFRAELPRLLGAPAATAVHGNQPVEGDVAGADQDVLRRWYAQAKKDLGVLQRASAMNRMFEAPRLVLEGRGRVMATGGGGAGMEQATGGAGQPNSPGDTISTPPPPADPKAI